MTSRQFCVVVDSFSSSNILTAPMAGLVRAPVTGLVSSGSSLA